MEFQRFKEQYLTDLFYFPVSQCTVETLVAHYHRLGADEKRVDHNDTERRQIVEEIKQRGLNPDAVLSGGKEGCSSEVKPNTHGSSGQQA